MNRHSLSLKQKQSGFTLIELIVVFTIVSLLTGVILVSAVSARESARDKARVTDVELLRGAVRMYVEKNFSYPTDGRIGEGVGDIDTQIGAHLPHVPHDPLGPGDSEHYYYYSNKQICAKTMETNGFSVTADGYCTTLGPTG